MKVVYFKILSIERKNIHAYKYFFIIIKNLLNIFNLKKINFLLHNTLFVNAFKNDKIIKLIIVIYFNI